MSTRVMVNNKSIGVEGTVLLEVIVAMASLLLLVAHFQGQPGKGYLPELPTEGLTNQTPFALLPREVEEVFE